MHGGDIYRNKIKYDFSVNINPLGPPDSVIEALLSVAENVTQYPDPDCELLRKKLSEKTGIESDQIVCGNGASELITAVVRAAEAKSAVIAAPSFSGYERALDAAGTKIHWLGLKAENDFVFDEIVLDECKYLINDRSADLVIIGNPNNPDGRLIDESILQELQLYCEKTDTLLVLDECFRDLTDSPRKQAATGRTVIINAFTKSFAVPGVRLGYCLCSSKETAHLVSRQLSEWSVSLFAQAAGKAALEKKDYLSAARTIIAEERDYLSSELARLGYKVYESDANYILFQDCFPSFNLKDRLIEHEILIRDCSDYRGLGEGFYRIAVKTHEENRILVRAIERVLQSEP